jgi:hypothetical protein
MQQLALEFDHDDRPGPVMEPERVQQLIALMAQAIAAALQSHQGQDHESA